MSTKFTFKAKDQETGVSTKTSFNADLLPEIVDQFADFLRGAGYVFDTLEVSPNNWTLKDGEVPSSELLMEKIGLTNNKDKDGTVKFINTED